MFINTYMRNAKDVVTLQAQMAGLPDGTGYVQQTILDATAKQLVANTTSASWRLWRGLGDAHEASASGFPVVGLLEIRQRVNTEPA